jgi:hypothetical protein
MLSQWTTTGDARRQAETKQETTPKTAENKKTPDWRGFPNGCGSSRFTLFPASFPAFAP